jgi:ceramide glucosyltransferase
VLILVAILAVLSALLALWQWVATWSFPLHQRVTQPEFTPPLTLLKPLKGLDDNIIGCIRSWLAQDYPAPVQVLLGVASSDDPVCAAVRELLAACPGLDVRLVICPESFGFNAKVSTLIQLQRLAKYDHLVISDADVLVPRDFLLNVVAPLRNGEVGLVNSFYRLANPTTLAMRWEAVAVNADFWSQVLQGGTMQSLDFALGAAMATRRGELEKIGGFESLADYLADDFQLGHRIARVAGKRIELCPVVVDCLSPPMSWNEVWEHQLRWARTIRACKPAPYAASILSNATFWPLLWAVCQPGVWALATLSGCVLLRVVSTLAMQTRLGPVPGQAGHWWLAPVKDLLQFALWVGAFAGSRVTWREQRFRLLSDGRLSPVADEGK